MALALSEYFKEVYATDISKGQLQNSFSKDNIHYLCNPAEDTIFKSDVFDLVTIAQAIHWFDFSKFYREVYRTLVKTTGYLCEFQSITN